MTFKRFREEDLVYNTIVAKPSYDFLVHEGSIYKNNDIHLDGDFGNKVKHVDSGHINFHELNINRPADSLVHGFIRKDTTRYSYRTVSTSMYDDSSQFAQGNKIIQNYPFSASLSRIYIPEGPEFSDHSFELRYDPTIANSNKRYITSLRNVLAMRDKFGESFEFGNMGTKKVNMICVPAIYYGSKISPGSIELNYYLSGTLVAQAKDSNSDGVLRETYGTSVGLTVGQVIYEQGLMLLTGSWEQHPTHEEPYFSEAGNDAPTWLTFGTGITQVGVQQSHGLAPSSSYGIKFEGVNKIPTLTMLAFSEKGEHGYSNNPTFFKQNPKASSTDLRSYKEKQKTIKNITYSGIENHSASFASTTYISKVGIYDENKNLIAIATLAKPLKNISDRDYMIKMRMDF